MYHPTAGRVRLKHAPFHRVRATDTTIFPIAMVTVLTVVLVLLMVLAVHQ
jgi:hypothetical protein